METTVKNTKVKKTTSIDSEKKFVEEYKEIFNTSENTVIIKNEWTNKGDYFQKLSIYDNSYSTVKTFGYTTLIK